jgi:hypothetical protein
MHASVKQRLDLTVESAKGVSGVPLFDEHSRVKARSVAAYHRDLAVY